MFIRTQGNPATLRIAHVIPSLAVGGAEMALLRLVESLDPERFHSSVFTLGAPGALAPHFRDAGIDVVSAGFRSGLAGFGALGATAHLRHGLRRQNPHVIQGWMYHGNVAAWLGRCLATPRAALVWGIRQTLTSLDHEPAGTRLAIRLGASLSSRPDKIVSNCARAVGDHVALGYDRSRFVVIPNGFDTQYFRPDARARAEVRAELGIPEEAFVVGLIGRVHPLKGHAFFFAALARLQSAGAGLHAILVGLGATRDNPAIVQAGVGEVEDDRCHLLGVRADVPKIMAALDVLVSASPWGEGFPNVVAEAMACGVPCVVTDRADSATIVSDTGLVVPPADAPALAEGIAAMQRLSLDTRHALGARARARIEACYSQQGTTARMVALYESLVSRRAEPQ